MTNNQDYIYDKEVYPNVWTCAVEHATSSQTWFFEISDERDDYDAFCQFIYELKNLNARMVGFNNIHYDNRIMHAMLDSHAVIPEQIYNVSDTIINGDDRWAYSVWESDWIVNQLDLYLIHHFDNKHTSLKILEFNMRSRNIKGLPFPPGTILTREQLPTLRQYNKHDVSETKKFYHHSLDAIKMREDLTAKYHRNFINHNDGKTGKDYFIMKLEEAIPGSCYYRDHNNRKQPRQSVRGSIPLEPIILKYIEFEQPEFNRVLNHFKSQSVDSRQIKGFFTKLNCTIDDVKYQFGAGGIHGCVIKSQTVLSDKDYMIVDVDVSSYYPNLAIANRFYPEHLSEQFCDIYQDVYNQRQATVKKSPENKMLKNALVCVFGDSNQIYSPFYDPAYLLSITINGQLLLCMLAEKLMVNSQLSIIQVNTDGVTVRLPRVHEQWLDGVCDWWEKLTKLKLEKAEYNRMFIKNVNSYIAEYTDGKLKRKKDYAYNRDDQGELPWYKNHSALVVAKAAEAALVHGQDIEEFIRNHNDFMDFMLRANVPKSSRLVGVVNDADTPLENVQRYYVSTSGVALVKIMPPLAKKPGIYRRIGIDVGWQVATCNDLADVKLPINYDYYIQRAKKLVDPLRSKNYDTH